MTDLHAIARKHPDDRTDREKRELEEAMRHNVYLRNAAYETSQAARFGTLKRGETRSS